VSGLGERGEGDVDRTGSGVPIVPAMDGFRAYAILGVVLLHVLGAAGILDATAGTTGGILIWGVLGNIIDAFFIISGFVLFLPTVVRSGEFGRLGRFARARAARLLPAYWLSLVVVLLLLAAKPPPPLALPGLTDIAVHLGALQMPARMSEPSLLLGFGVNGPVWMISIIFGFYLVLPLIARSYFRHPLLGLALALGVTLGWKALVLHTGLVDALTTEAFPRWALELTAIDQLPGWALSFALGMTGAWAYVRVLERYPREVVQRRALHVLPFALIAYVGLAYLYGRTSLQVAGAITGSLARTDMLETALGSVSRAALMAAIVLGPIRLQRPFANRATSRIAEHSYGFYLAHAIVITYLIAFAALPGDGSLLAFAVWSAIVIPASLAYAYVSRTLVEQPIRRRIQERERRDREVGGPAERSG